MCPSTWMTEGRRTIHPLQESGPDPNTLQLSKAINLEAAALCYSESTFLCCLGSCQKRLCLSQASVDRMMKIELRVLAGLQNPDYAFDDSEDQNQNQKWEIMINRLNTTDLVRKSVQVRFSILSLELTHVLPPKILHDLKSVKKYRTVTVEFSVTTYSENGSGRQTNKDGRFAQKLGLMTEVVMRVLEPALGPASLCQTRPPNRYPGYIYYSSYLKFHPHETMATKSEVPVEKVGLERGKMHHKAGGTDRYLGGGD